VADIVRAADVADGTVYLYFKARKKSSLDFRSEYGQRSRPDEAD
jgi:AcrR family transcriptional regulator